MRPYSNVILRRAAVMFLAAAASAAALVGVTGAPAAPASSQTTVRAYLQPHRGVTLYVGGQKTAFRVLKRDKTLALIRFRIEGDSAALRLEKQGFRALQATFRADEERTRRSRKKLPRLLQLRRPHSQYELVGYHRTGRWPKSITFLDANRVVVPLLESKGIDVVRIDTGARERLTAPGRDGRYKGYVETLVLPDRGEFLVSQMTRAAVHVFGIQDLKHRRTIKLRAAWSKVLLHDKGRGRVYVSNWATKNISVIDLGQQKEIKRYPAQGVPRGMVLSADGRYLYAGQFTHIGESDGRGRIVKFDAATGRILKKFGAYGAKRHLVRKGNRLFVSDMARARVEVYDLDTEKEVKRIPVYYKPNTIALSPDGRRLYVSCRGPNNPAGYTKPGLVMGRIYVIDTEKLEVAEWWRGGNQPTGLDVSADGRWLVTSDFMDNRLRVYRRLAGPQS